MMERAGGSGFTGFVGRVATRRGRRPRHRGRRQRRAPACRERRDHRVIIGIGEKGDGHAVAPGAVPHPMRGRDEPAIGPALHHVGDINHEAAGDGLSRDPEAGAGHDLEPADLVLEKDGEGAGVGMRFDALDVRIGRLRRIVQEVQLGQGFAEMGGEEIVCQFEPVRRPGAGGAQAPSWRRNRPRFRRERPALRRASGLGRA